LGPILKIIGFLWDGGNSNISRMKIFNAKIPMHYFGNQQRAMFSAKNTAESGGKHVLLVALFNLLENVTILNSRREIQLAF
jgi:hypothetical protein